MICTLPYFPALKLNHRKCVYKIFHYLFSAWGTIANTIVMIVFGLVTYNSYAKR